MDGGGAGTATVGAPGDARPAQRDPARVPQPALPVRRPRPGRDRLPRLAARLAAGALAGLLLLVAAPPYDLWPLAPLGVAVAVLAVRGAGLRAGAAVGLVAGLAHFAPMLRWAAPVAGPDAWLLLATSQAVAFALLGAGLALVVRLRGAALWVAALWVLQEALRDRGPFGGFPWGRLAHTQVDGPLAGLAALGGAPLVTAAVGLTGGSLAVAVASLVRAPGARRPRAGRAAVAVAAVAAVAAVGVAGLAAPAVATGGTTTGETTVAVVQGGVPGSTLEELARQRVVLDNHVALTAELARAVAAGDLPEPDLVIWPENSSDIDPFAVPEARRAIEAAAAGAGVPVLAGVIEGLPDRRRANTSVVVDPVGGLGERYVKRAPVPFAEYLPFRPLVRQVFTRVDRLLPRDMVAGDAVGLLPVAGVPVGVLICFEVAFDDLVRDVVTEGASLVVVQTNNATFGDLGEAEQQLAMARLRAVEHGRTVVVSSTSGISAVVEPSGAVRAATGTYTSGVLVETVPLREGLTVATRVGPLPEAALAALALVGLGLGVRSRRGAGRAGAA